MRNNLRLSLLAPVLLAVVGSRARAEPAPLGVTHVGLHTGVVLPQLGSELGTAPGVELEGGYRAPPRLTLSLSVSCAQPTVAHAGDDPRLAAGSFDSETVQRELTVGAVAAWWFLPPSARLSGFAGVGYRQFFLASVTDGSSGGMPFLEHRETSSQGRCRHRRRRAIPCRAGRRCRGHRGRRLAATAPRHRRRDHDCAALDRRVSALPVVRRCVLLLLGLACATASACRDDAATRDAGGDGAAPAPDAAVRAGRHEAGPYRAYFGLLHDHHYGVNAGDDGGLEEGAPDEPGVAGSNEWRAWRGDHPEHYVGGDAVSAYTRAAQAGLDFFALTPHNHLIDIQELAAVLDAAERADGIVALAGQEWSSVISGNHVIVMNVTQRVTVSNGEYATLLGDWLPGYLAARPGAAEDPASRPFLSLAHPALEAFGYGPAEKALLEYGLDDYATRAAWAAALSEHARLVELLSGDELADNSLARVLELLNDGITVGFSAGQDNHRQRWGTRNDSRMGALATGWGKTELSEALHARRTYVTDDRDLGMHVALLAAPGGDVLAWMGESVAAPTGTTLTLEVGVEDPTGPTDTYRIEVLVDDAVGGGPARVVLGPTPAVGAGVSEYTVPAPPPGGYLIVHVATSRSRDAWASPIWLR